jgi:Uma2 family endonuclease
MQLVIELPPREEQLAFNRKRWKEICADPEVERLPGKIESNAHGQIVMMPPASGDHSDRQGEILFRLRTLLGGFALPECPVSTLDGVRAVDVGWYSESRFSQVRGQFAFEIAPEICVEVLSPSNTPAEMAARRQFLFEAGAEEFWLCDEAGIMTYHLRHSPDTATPTSALCPAFPASL